MKNKINIVNFWELSKINPEENPIPSNEDLAKLGENDFVFLIFQEDENEERMWVRITKPLANDKFEGVLANDPAIITGMDAGEKVYFGLEHIVNFSTQKEQERIINEFKKTGRLPLAEKKIKFEDIYLIIEELLTMAENKNENIHPLFKIKRIDRIFFKKNLEEIATDYKKSQLRNKLISRIFTQDVSKMFLSLVLVIVLPQVSQNLDEGKFEYNSKAKDYYRSLIEILEKILKVFKYVASENSQILLEIRSFYNDEELNAISDNQLPQLFEAFIEETIRSLEEIT